MLLKISLSLQGIAIGKTQFMKCRVYITRWCEVS